MTRSDCCTPCCGHTIATVTTSELAVSECGYSPGIIPRHTHEHAAFCLVLDGAFVESSATASLQCVPSTLLFHPAGAEHRNEMSRRGGRCFHVEIADAVMASLPDRARAVPRLGGSGAAHMVAYRLLAETRRPDSLTPTVVEELSLALVSELARDPGVRVDRTAPVWLARVRDHVHESFAHPPSLETLAATAGVHRVHVARALRSYYECTIGGYVRKRRIEFACHALATSDMSLSQVAASAGFADQSHLTTAFRRAVGVTPGAFRGGSGV